MHGSGVDNHYLLQHKLCSQMKMSCVAAGKMPQPGNKTIATRDYKQVVTQVVIRCRDTNSSN